MSLGLLNNFNTYVVKNLISLVGNFIIYVYSLGNFTFVAHDLEVFVDGLLEPHSLPLSVK